MASRSIDDATIPDDLSPRGRRVAELLVKAVTRLKDGEPPYTGGCRAFYSPAEWSEREDGYDLRDVELVVVHDGGDFAPCFNLAYEADDWWRAAYGAVSAAGCWAEPITAVYTFVMRD